MCQIYLVRVIQLVSAIGCDYNRSQHRAWPLADLGCCSSYMSTFEGNVLQKVF